MRGFRIAFAVIVGVGVAASGRAGADGRAPKTVADARVPLSFLKNSTVPKTAVKSPRGLAGKQSAARVQGGVPGVDSLINFTDSFTEPGFDFNGNPQSVWPYEMVGRAPQSGQVSLIDSPIVPVVVDLLGPDGKVATTSTGVPLTLDPRRFARPVVASPMFQFFPYNTGFTQFNDAMMRNQFWDRIQRRGDSDNGYHVFLIPSIRQAQHMRVPFGSYFFGEDADGNPAFALIDGNVFSSLLFPSTVPVDNTTVIGAAELAGDMTTRALTNLLFDNVFLFDGDLSNCCVLGFHTYDFEPGDAHNGNKERRFVFDYASWITPGFFAFGFQDITALSHELNEAFNDPFVDNQTPWWLNVDPFFGNGICQDNLETGDVIEILSSNPVFPIQMNGMTYHPQNETNVSWFQFKSPSAAKNGSYSFPDETTLTTLSPSNLLPGCVPGP